MLVVSPFLSGYYGIVVNTEIVYEGFCWLYNNGSSLCIFKKIAYIKALQSSSLINFIIDIFVELHTDSPTICHFANAM